MSIAKADILTFINDNLKRSETAAQVAVPIQTVLNELSDLELLVDTDTSQALSDGSLTLDYPTDFISLISILLIDGNSVRQDPLKKLTRGHRQYEELRDNDSATGDVGYFSEFNSKFWLWRPAGASYTTEIKHYKRHAQNVDSIEFGDEFRNVINFGAAFYVACKYKLKDYMGIWGPQYERAKEVRRIAMPRQPHIVRG